MGSSSSKYICLPSREHRVEASIQKVQNAVSSYLSTISMSVQNQSSENRDPTHTPEQNKPRIKTRFAMHTAKNLCCTHRGKIYHPPHAFPSSEIALPQHPIQIFSLLLGKRLGKKTGTVSMVAR